MSINPNIAQKAPYFTQQKKKDKVAWCSCGYSLTQPFCDNAHKKAETNLGPMAITCEEEKEYVWCGCKFTKTPPYCDGSHAKL